MFLPFFLELKAAKVPVSLREYLTLLEGMEADLVTYDVEGFYYLSRAALVKDERHIDRFDQVFGHVFKIEAGFISEFTEVDFETVRGSAEHIDIGSGAENPIDG